MQPAPLHATLQRLLGEGYKLESELLGGGMSRVFVAEERALRRKVVVKVLPPDLMDARSLSRFEREVEVTARLQHPHILTIVSAGTREGLSWYVTPYIEGRSLRDRIDADQRPSRDEALRYVAEVAEAVAFAHARGVVHRDIKPGNVLLHEGHAVLADFGVARALAGEDDGGSITGIETHAGLEAYLPPDRPRGEGADLWAIGALAHELATGAPPAHPVTARGVQELLDRDPARRGTPNRALASFIARALAPDPSTRFPDATALLGELRRLRAAEATGGSTWRSRVATIALVAAGATLVAPMVLDRVRDEAPAARPIAVEVPDSVPAAGAWRDSLVVALREWRDVAVAASGADRRVQRLRIAPAPDGSAMGMLFGSNDRPIATVSLTGLGGAPSLDGARRVVSQALRATPETPFARGSRPGSESLAAWRAFDAARAPFARAQFAAAESLLLRVVEADPGHRGAQVRLALLYTWGADTSRAADATILLRESTRGRGVLPREDSLRREGWTAVSAARWQAACAAFDTLLAHSADAWDAWLGRGDCLLHDERVVADARSPTGYVFVVGREASIAAYERAIGLLGGRAPPMVYERFRRSVPLESHRLRRGTLTGYEGMVAGRPEAIGDTIGHYPTPTFSTRPIERASLDGAVARGRRRALVIAKTWVKAAPDEPRALLLLSELLEFEGSLLVPGDDGWSALEAVQRVARMPGAPVSRARLAADESRILFKGGRLAPALAVAGRALREHPRPSRADATTLLPLAALLGDRERILALLPAAGGSSGQLMDIRANVYALPPPLLDARSRFHAAVLAGACDDDVRFGFDRVRRAVDALEPDSARRALLLEVLTARTRRIATPCLGPAPEPVRHVRADRDWAFLLAASTGDKATFDSLVAARDGARRVPDASDTADLINALAWGAVQLGDSAAAYARLSAYFSGMSTAPNVLFSREEESAALRRSLLLARALAARLPGVDPGAWWLADAPSLEPVARAPER